MQVHYARGCSLAESFYQAVNGPYQLLIVGDPLCRPWARIPLVELAAFDASQPVSGELVLAPTATCGEQGIAEMRLFVDGALHSTAAPGESFSLDTTALVDGYHELRFVAIEDSPIESQGRLIVPITVANSEASLEWSLQPADAVPMDQHIAISVNAPGAEKIVIVHLGRAVAEILGSSGEVALAASELGMGPANLQAVAIRPAGGPLVYSPPAEIEVTLPSLLSAQAGVRAAALTPGVRVSPQGAAGVVVARTEGTWLSDAGVTRDQPFVLNGYFQVDEDGMAQFQANFSGRLSITVDGRRLIDQTHESPGFLYVPVGLAAGWHEFSATAVVDNLRDFRLDFGVEGAAPLSVAGFHCQP